MRFIEKKIILGMDPRDLTVAEFHGGVNERVVRPLVKAREDGAWDTTQEGILVANRRDDGTIVLIDGVQRVEAARRAGLLVDVVVYEGLSPQHEAMMFTDINSEV